MLERYIVATVVQNGDKFILGKKAKGRPPYPDVWHTPGGGVDNFKKAQALYSQGDFDNEFFHEELRREIREELGVEIQNIKNIVPHYRPEPRVAETPNKHGEMTRHHFLEYLCDYVSGAMKPDDDLAEARWVTKDDLPNLPLTPPSQEMYRELGWLRSRL